jgi:hypothetical protein
MTEGPGWHRAKPNIAQESSTVERSRAKLQSQVEAQDASPERVQRAMKSVTIGIHRRGPERTKVEATGKAADSAEVAAYRAKLAETGSSPAVTALAAKIFGAAAA